MFKETIRVPLSLSLLFAVILVSAGAQVQAAHPYLDDANKGTPPGNISVPINHHKFPRVYVHEMLDNTPLSAYSKYHFIDSAGGDMKKMEQLKPLYPETLYLRHISGRAYQSYGMGYCRINQGMAFESTGPVTQGGPETLGCDFFAGHFLYKAGTKLRQSINATTTTLKVDDARRITVGQFVVIYDAPAGSFTRAEHAQVTGRNLSTNTITLKSRGFKSTPRSHPAGAIVAEHVLGQGKNPQLWAFNMTTKSPRDGSGRRFGTVYADWLEKNYNRHANGKSAGNAINGIVFDADFYYDLGSKAADANNDLVTDNGVGANGDNWLGLGLDDFYAKLRARLPGKIILGGMADARGFASLQGTQMENFPDFGNGDFNPNPKYKHLDSQIQWYLFNSAERDVGAPNVHNLTKTPTKQYPGKASPAPKSNAPMRFVIGLTLLDDGYVGTHARHTPDAWWDEYAVDVTPGSANYGNAIPKSDTGRIRKHRGWLGDPLGPFVRIYNDAAFAASNSLVNNGNLNSNLNGWSGVNVNVSLDTTTSQDGAGSLRASKHTSYKKLMSGATIRGPQVSLVNGKQYTLAFSAKASKRRMIRVNVGTEIQKVLVGTRWRRYVLTFTQTRNQSTAIKFEVGREDSQVWIDSLYLFEGNANVFRRDFENGIVVVNATPNSRTINLGGQFQRINGTQDPVNDGRRVSSVTLGKHDALLLVRLDGQQQDGGDGGGDGDGGGGTTNDDGGGGGTNSGGGSKAACGKPQNLNPGSRKGVFVWQRCATGEWHVSVTAGGSASTVTHKGNLISDRPLDGITKVSVESLDSFTRSNKDKRIDFTFKVSNSGSDGFRFRLRDTAGMACLRLGNGGPIYLGWNGVKYSAPLNLLDPGAPCF